ncbi:MAG: hypothetical protein GWM98_22955, partial [Nitrospinaceae bacterium]|nr:hypothetical protein [Nitrospinaceae bacterium]NIR56803.1 hypothetical protein [Nitrospinaceae bacterium]NIS87259.1 hypothetical protein [Nitrospinaceae bacterium]NIT84112.1 hypothetical protein [Nitrospinaceae bacterium]NIU46299.1 hypothetical protein [Nitrospinaceae bacterium]
ATIRDNRLFLTSATGADTAINLNDNGNVLLSLGFFELDGNGQKVQKTEQFDFSSGSAVNLNQTGSDAEIVINGETFTSADNQFTEIFEGVA